MEMINCGSLRATDAGKSVTLRGWIHTIRDHGNAFFIDLRDHYGITQVIFKFDEIGDQLQEQLNAITRESVVELSGVVKARPEGTANPKLKTGEIEIAGEQVTLLNACEKLPYNWQDADKTTLFTRLRYRYVDLRNPKIHEYIIKRSEIVAETRRYMDGRGFLDIETPFLTKSTPEGARDYLVPSRVHKGKFYALPQSPQLFKQMLMISGFDKYYQVVRCFRDEDLRPDRQPEFTQIDLEMAFPTIDDVIDIVEGLMGALWKNVLGVELDLPFPRMTYEEAMNRFGSDKPDTRFDLEIRDITDLMPSDLRIFKDVFASETGCIKAINATGYGNISKKKWEKLRRFVQIFNAKDVGNITLKDGKVRSPLGRFIAQDKIDQIVERMEAHDGDLIMFIGGEQEIVHRALGELRLEVAKQLDLIPEDQYNFLWVVDFPLFEWDADEHRWTAMHHPFTRPLPESVADFDTNQKAAKAAAYDIVLNGYELGGGSLRIHEPDLQSRIFEALGITPEIVERNFSFLVEALRYGAPPHGGLALGLDRMVMLMVGVDNINEIIAFPKTRTAVLPLGNAPNIVTEDQLEELGIEIKEEYRLLLEADQEDSDA